jgi:hypothetical protein
MRFVDQYGDLYWKLLRGREGSAAARSQTVPEGEFFCAKRNESDENGGCRSIGAQQNLAPATA